MITKAHKKLTKIAAMAAVFSFVSLSVGQAAADSLGGSLTPATPYDQRLNVSGVLSMNAAPMPGSLHSSDELFFQARSIRYVTDKNGRDYWQTPQETQARWAGDCEDKALWLFAELKKNSHVNVRLVVGRYRSIDRNYHVWVTMADNEGHVWVLDPTAQKKIWRSTDFGAGFYRPLYSFDGINRYRHDA